MERVREGGPGTPRLRRPGSAQIPLHTVIWFELWVTAVERAKAFYGELLVGPSGRGGVPPGLLARRRRRRPGTIRAPWVSDH